jgi:penicillin-binding protein 1A
MMDVLTRGVVQRGGTAPLASVVPNARGKTGTTNKAKDAWFCGYTDGLVGVAWVGNEQIINGVPHALPMASSVYGGTVAAKIWAAVMNDAYDRFHRVRPDEAPAFDETERPVATRRRHERAEPVTPSDESVPDEITLPDDSSADSGSADTGDDPPVNSTDTDPPVATPPKTPPPDPAVEEQKRRDAARKAEEARQKQLDDILARERERDRQREAERRQRNQGTETVRVEVCADSGLRASAYCPETVIRTFAKGEAPRRRCNLHRG